MPVSNDTLLRVVRRRGSPSFAPPAIIGIDDWAWRRNQRYGTLICDLERRKTIALPPDREPATAETVTVAAIESGVALLVGAREIVADFHAMIRRKALAELDP
jgi:hypothetical protein